MDVHLSAPGADVASTLLAGLGEPILLLDRNSRTVYANAEAQRLFDACPASLRTEIERSAASVRARRRPELFEYFDERSGYWYEGRAFPAENESVAVRLHDITRLKLNQQRMDLTRANLAAVLANMVEAVFEFDSEFRFTFVNAAAEEQFGKSRSSLIGKTLWQEFSNVLGTSVEGAYRRAMSERTPVTLEYRHMPGDRWFELDIYPAGSEGVVVFCREATDRKRFENEARGMSERLILTLESASLGLWWFPLDPKDFSVSRVTGTVHGFPADAPVIRDLAGGVVHPDDRECVDRTVREAIETGAPFESEHRVQVNGSVRWVLSRGRRMTDPESGSPLLMGLVQDITERRLAAEALQRTKERLDIASQSGNVGIFDWFIQTGELVWNEVEERLFGLEPGTFEGNLEGWAKRVHPDDLTAAQAHLENCMAQRLEDVDFEFRIIRRGEVAYISGSGRFYYDAHGKAVRMIGFNQDVTARKRMEETLRDRERELEQRTAALAQSNEDLQRFAYITSHDLQEPLRTIGSYSELLARRNAGKLDADSEVFIRYVLDGVGRMQMLIRDLLEFSRVSHGVCQPIGRVDMNAALQRALEHLQFTIADADAAVTSDHLPTVYANETRMTQVFQNIVGNAIKYCERKPSIHVSARPDGRFWTMSVTDNGIGIGREYYDKVFGLFQRLHGRDRYSGTGLGLAICKRIVEQQGGRIWLESIPGQGSTFFFTVPAEPREGA